MTVRRDDFGQLTLDPEQVLRDKALSTSNENVLEIKVIEHVSGKWHAYYVGEKVHVEGSTPYMAVRSLIDSFNTTDVWSRRYAQKT